MKKVELAEKPAEEGEANPTFKKSYFEEADVILVSGGNLETSLSRLKLTSEIEPVFENGCVCFAKWASLAYVLYCFGLRFRPSDMKACRLRTLDKLLASFGGGFMTLFSHDFDYSFAAFFQYIFAVPFWYLAKSIYRLHSVTFWCAKCSRNQTL